MPTYEYECLTNGHRFEAFQTMTEPPLDSCPECGGEARRLISGGAGIIFRGAGFYQTDYRSESYRKAEQAERSATATSSPPESDAPSASSAKKSASGSGNGDGKGSGE